MKLTLKINGGGGSSTAPQGIKTADGKELTGQAAVNALLEGGAIGNQPLARAPQAAPPQGGGLIARAVQGIGGAAQAAYQAAMAQMAQMNGGLPPGFQIRARRPPQARRRNRR